MKITAITSVKTAEEARDLAIDYQNWSSEESLSYSELLDWQEYFETLGKKFNLIDEFKENGIV